MSGGPAFSTSHQEDTMPDTPFVPAVHGFHFVNTYINYFVPGVTTSGRCGGMSYAALDFFFAGVPVPGSQSRQVKGIDATARDVDHIDLFAWGEDDAVWHRTFFRNGWADWQPLGGIVTSAPSAASWGPNHIDLFARGTDNAIWHKNWDGTHWADWSSIGGELTSGPDACSWGPGRVDVFARGTDNALWHIWYDGAWHPWESLGGEITSDPTAVSHAVGVIDVYARGTDNALWTKNWNGHVWNDWASLGGNLTSAPDAASWGGNRVDVVALDVDAHMGHRAWQEPSWSSWEAIDTIGVFQGDPSAAARPGVLFGPPRLDVFGIGQDQGVWQNHFENGWHGWNANAVDVPGDTTALGDFIYRRQITSLVDEGPGFASRIGAQLWTPIAGQFRWGITTEPGGELAKLRAAIDAGRPTPLGLIGVGGGTDSNHQVVAIGYDLGGDPASTLRIRIYDPNEPDVVCTLTPNPADSSYDETRTDNGASVDAWRTYFVGDNYHAVTPLS
jgi:hypothetical protein